MQSNNQQQFWANQMEENPYFSEQSYPVMGRGGSAEGGPTIPAQRSRYDSPDHRPQWTVPLFDGGSEVHATVPHAATIQYNGGDPTITPQVYGPQANQAMAPSLLSMPNHVNQIHNLERPNMGFNGSMMFKLSATLDTPGFQGVGNVPAWFPSQGLAPAPVFAPAPILTPAVTAGPVQRIQAPAMNFQCSYCGDIFRRKGDCTRHVRTKHGNTQGQFLCPYGNCPKSQGQGYSRKDKLTEHLWKNHGAQGHSKRSY